MAFALYDAPIWNLALIASSLHLVWVQTICGKMKTEFPLFPHPRLNTFPCAKLTEKNKEDLTRCAENILLAREAHFPDTLQNYMTLKDAENQPKPMSVMIRCSSVFI